MQKILKKVFALSTVILLVAILFVLFTSNQNFVADGNVQDKNIELSDFNKLKISNDYYVVVQKSSDITTKPTCTITASANVIDLIDVIVNNGELSIQNKKGKIFSSNDIKISLVISTLSSIEVNDETSVFVYSGDILTKSFDCEINDNATLKMSDINIDNLNCSMDNDGKFLMAGNGKVKNATIFAQKCSKFIATDLKIGRAVLNVNDQAEVVADLSSMN
ncbi:MAG: DUF2807 domain-containing protein [Clostridia bacterium]